jgi:protocatechuate 3,4-dioxygenase beta subunit
MNRQGFLKYSITSLLVLILGVSLVSIAIAGAQTTCEATPEDEMGPFYKPGAPYRTSVGTGYLLLGTVKSTKDCQPIEAAMVELWMTGPDGQYGDAWRATLFSAENGTYYFTSNAPTDYGNRRPHIHIRATAEGFTPLVTQHYPVSGAGEGLFDLVLTPISE